MLLISRGSVIFLAALLLTVPFQAPMAAPNTEERPPDTGNAKLAEFVRAVVDSNPAVNAARAALDASAALEAAASRPLYNPQLQLNAEDADTKTRALGISQTIDWGGKRRARLSVAEAERHSAGAEFKSVRWQVTVELLSALASYQTESDRSALNTVRVAAMRDFANLSQRRFDAGDISQIDLDLALLAHAEARMQQATAAANVAQSKQGVSSLVTGIPESRWPVLGTKPFPAEVSGADDHTLVMALPHVRVVSFQAEAARARIDLRERERRLDPTLTIRGGREEDETLVGVNVTIPLRVRNNLRNEVIAASAEYRQAQQLLSDVSRRAYARLLGARDRFQISQNAWQDWTRTGDVSLQSQSELLQRLWRAGELSPTEYLVQLKQTLDTSESALELRGILWNARFEWMIASGRIETWLDTAPD